MTKTDHLWTQFINSWADIAQSAAADIQSEAGCVADPTIPEDISNGRMASKFVIHDTTHHLKNSDGYVNCIKDARGIKLGVSVTAVRLGGQYILTIHDIIEGRLSCLNVLTSNSDRISLRAHRLVVDPDACTHTLNVEKHDV